jgi:MinD-like ATPase involved in chromosome partitioning or flagellar assembly
MDKPKVIVVGSQQFADLLAKSGALWQISPAVDSINAMWDAMDAGLLPQDARVFVITDGTGTADGELEASLAAVAPFAHTFFVSKTDRAQVISDRVKTEAAQVEGGDPSAPVHHLPAESLKTSLSILRQVTEYEISWPETGGSSGVPAPPRPAVRPSASPAEPAPQESSTPFNEDAKPAAQPSDSSPLPGTTSGRDYEMASVYDSRIVEEATLDQGKPKNAKPGQMTIACMSSKGGSGKSTTAISLAATIARTSAAAGDPKKVVIVDLDTRDGQIGSLINQYMPTAVSIRVLPQWNAETVQQNLVHDKNLGVDALLAPLRPRNADDVGPDFYREIIRILQTTHDVVIMDCSVNYLDPLLGVGFSLADEILFVTTLATTSVQGMARALTELFASPEDGGLGINPGKVGVVANQVIRNVGMDKDKLLQAALGCRIVGSIPAEYDEVLIQTNSNRMHNLIKHPTLGPAYFNLAKNCLPGYSLAPVTYSAKKK